jgi:FMN phosphatase YigB (HAD superfamily)
MSMATACERTTSMNGIRALVFDIFGTLVDWRGGMIDQSDGANGMAEAARRRHIRAHDERDLRKGIADAASARDLAPRIGLATDNEDERR